MCLSAKNTKESFHDRFQIVKILLLYMPYSILSFDINARFGHVRSFLESQSE